MKILVTGGTGFIGSHLADRLIKDGHKVVVPIRTESSLDLISSNEVETVKADLLDFEACRSLTDGVDVVFHLASIRGSGWEYTEEQIWNTNLMVTENILKASAGKVKHFIYISSVSVYGHFIGGPADENYPFDPATRYGITKHESENIVNIYHKEKGLNTTIIRPVITYGPRDTWGMVTKLSSLIHSRKYLTVGSGENRVHLMYIDDMIDGLVLAMNNEKAFGKAFILAGEEPVTINRLVELAGNALEKPVPGVYVPYLLAFIAASLLEFTYRVLKIKKEPFITKDKIDIMCRDRCFNIEKARECIGFAPRVSYEEGVKKTIDWLKNYKSFKAVH